MSAESHSRIGQVTLSLSPPAYANSGAPRPRQSSAWGLAATPATVDIFIQHSNVTAVVLSPLRSPIATPSPAVPLNDSAQAGTGTSVVAATMQLLTEPVPPPTWLTIICLSGSKLAATVRPGVGGPSGAQRFCVICWAVRATGQTRTPYSWPTNSVVEPNPAPSWRTPAACCGLSTVSVSAVATPSL